MWLRAKDMDKKKGVRVPVRRVLYYLEYKKLPEGGATPDVEKAVGRKIKAYLKWDLQFKSWKCEDFMPATGAVEK